MKKWQLTAMVALAGAMQAQAQIGQGFHAGLTSGIYYNYMIDKGLSDSPTYDYDKGKSWYGAPIGLRAGYQWESGGGLMTELNLEKQGQTFDILDYQKNVVGRKEVKLSYLQVPLLFSLVSGMGKVKFNFFLGPQISFLQKGTEKNSFSQDVVRFHNQNLGTGEPAPIPVKDQGLDGIVVSTEAADATDYKFNSVALGGIFGVGVHAYLTEKVFLTGNLRFNYQFTDVREEKDQASPRKYVDQVRFRPSPTSQEVTRELATPELRNILAGGFQFGVHYLFAQD